MTDKLSVIYYSLSDLYNREALNYICNKVYELLSTNHLTAIENAFQENARIGSNGLIYLRVKGLAQILRTGSSGAERYLVYQGIDDVLAPAEVISIDGEEFISGPTLVALLDYRISSAIGKKKMYLNYSKNIYEYIRELDKVINIREMHIESIDDNRKYLKKKRIDKYNITKCEFTGIEFSDLDEVEFAHIDSVVTDPNSAISIENGVIILKSIHRELTRRKIHDYRGMYDFCIENNYKTDWAEKVYY